MYFSLYILCDLSYNVLKRLTKGCLYEKDSPNERRVHGVQRLDREHQEDPETTGMVETGLGDVQMTKYILSYNGRNTEIQVSSVIAVDGNMKVDFESVDEQAAIDILTDIRNYTREMTGFVYSKKHTNPNFWFCVGITKQGFYNHFKLISEYGHESTEIRKFSTVAEGFEREPSECNCDIRTLMMTGCGCGGK